ncbi:MAG: hypothetical protein HQK52_23025 [Oligoflexia bacterium]|nr:hypothetical protein [Oligoflexia bacterium]
MKCCILFFSFLSIFLTSGAAHALTSGATCSQLCHDVKAVNDFSCESYPEQSQVIGNVLTATPILDADTDICEITLEVTYLAQHYLCPFTSPVNPFIHCGKCPEIGSRMGGELLFSNDRNISILY